MNAPANVPAKREVTQIDVIKSDLSKRADEFKMVLPSHITVDKFQRIVATAALSNPQLLNCNRQSMLLACMKLAQDGLLPDGREAALVPFKTWNKDTRENVWEVQAMPMAWGLRKKILQSGEVVSLETGLVYRAEVESGNFLYEIGIDPPIRHRPKLDMTDEEMADENIVAAYSIARLKNANSDPYWSVEVMRRSEINKVRQSSQTGAVGRVVKGGPNAGKPIEPKGPWVDWFGEMARKTVLRRHSKVLPMSGDLLDTFERDDAENLRAEGAAQLLQAEEVKPLQLPCNEDLDGQGEGKLTERDIGRYDEQLARIVTREDIDPDTGEVLTRDPATGMTQVSEEVARQLDAGSEAEEEAQPGESGDASPAQAEEASSTGTATSSTEPASSGEPAPSAQDRASVAAQEDEPAWLAAVRGIRGSIEAARTPIALGRIEQDWVNKVMNGVPDELVVREIDGMIAAKKRELKQAEGGR